MPFASVQSLNETSAIESDLQSLDASECHGSTSKDALPAGGDMTLPNAKTSPPIDVADSEGELLNIQSESFTPAIKDKPELQQAEQNQYAKGLNEKADEVRVANSIVPTT